MDWYVGKCQWDDIGEDLAHHINDTSISGVSNSKGLESTLESMLQVKRDSYHTNHVHYSPNESASFSRKKLDSDRV